MGRLGCFCREIVDNHEKENALNIVTEERTYHIYAESPEDARYVIPTFAILIRFALSARLCKKKKKTNSTSGNKVPPSGCQWYVSKFYL